jgi:DNA repair exonuclease SbcCD ATPase subunit
MKVVIENFQSIKHIDFEVKGLTVITGPNNTGKSACARALSGVFSNPRGHSYVRQGEKQTSVKVSLEDGNVILWEKGKGVNRYEINGTPIDKVGTQIPDELKALGVVSVDVDGKEVWPQIARQFEQVFLLDMPPSVLSSALSDVDSIQTLEGASSLARGETRSLKAKVKVKLEDLEIEKARMPLFDGLESAEDLVDQVSALQTSINDLESNLDFLTRVNKERKALEMIIQNLIGAERVSIPYINPHQDQEISELIKIKRDKNKLHILEMIVGVGLDSFPLFPEMEKVKDPSKLQRILDKRQSLLGLIDALEGLDISLPSISLDVDEALSLAEERRALSGKINQAESQVDLLTSELEKVKHEIGDTCPLCEQGINH